MKKGGDRLIRYLNEDFGRLFSFNSPVNVTIVDQFGREISEARNEIPGADLYWSNLTHTKIFFLPLNLSYSVRIVADDYGNCAICQITPIDDYLTAFSCDVFNLTSQTVAEFNLTAFDANYTMNVDENGDGVFDYQLPSEVETITSEWDVGIAGVFPSKTVVGQGYNLLVNITVVNYGSYSETFNVSLHVNNTIIGLQVVSLPSGNSTILTYTCNSAVFTKGNYSINVVADAVPGETNLADNTFIDGWVFVTIPGDVNGDRDVDIYDIVRMAGVYSVSKPDPRYDPNCDIDDDGDIDIYDIVAATGNYGESW